MPVLIPTTYETVEQVLLDARAICNDMEIEGGDILTDDAPFSIQFVNLAYRHIQSYLAQYGVETFATYTWLIGIPANTTGDPESRILIDSTGTILYTPSGIGEAAYASPVLPVDLVAPLDLRERQNGTTNFAMKMFRRNNGLIPYLSQAVRLVDWEWAEDDLRFRGATAVVDVELKYERNLTPLVTVDDVVPIRGVNNAAAYQTAYAFTKSRGGAMGDGFGAVGQQEMDLLVNRSMRERQRVKHRRRPYRGYGGGLTNYRR